MAERVYLDYNATAPLRPEARLAMLQAMDIVGNPASVHKEGRAAKRIVENARRQVAEMVGCQPDEIIFTSGATEAASILAELAKTRAIVVQDTAHDALWVHNSHQSDAAQDSDGDLVFAMGLANSETGIITPPPDPEGGRWPLGVGRYADWLLLDVTQAVGRIPFSFAWSGAQMAILSAHKLGGPKGVGALVVRRGTDISPVLKGGGQEMGRRSGTENIVGISGFGAAAAASSRDLADGVWENVAEIRKILESALADGSKDTIFVGYSSNRLPNTSCFALPGWKGETQVMQMDLAGYAVSAGSACSSGKVKSSRVLAAMGYGPDVAGAAIRVSLGPGSQREDVLRFAEVWRQKAARYRARAA
ncbi:MAG: cysteine desulfurase family protein [Pseudomonadota bacterium]